MKLNRSIRVPLWVATGFLYGLSWPVFEGVNLSWLAWFAFVPLFVFLEKNQSNKWVSILGSYGSIHIFGIFSTFWFYKFPESFIKLAVMSSLEYLYITFPFFIFYYIHRRIGFQKALWVFPCLWTGWEWCYLQLEFTMGTHLTPYTQVNNLWAIQYIDITGMWGISFWVMLFNVLIFKAYKASNYKVFNRIFLKKAIKPAFIMLLCAMVYTPIAHHRYGQRSQKSLLVSLIPTQYSAEFLLDTNNQTTIVEQTLHRSDSLAFAQIAQNIYSDLFVWPETGLSYELQYANLAPLLTEAVADWESALITGCQFLPDEEGLDNTEGYQSAALISHKKATPAYHHKTVLTPGQEIIPYSRQLAKVPGFASFLQSEGFKKKGAHSLPIALTTRQNENFHLGISLCFEQWYPGHWAALARNGAEIYLHMAGEGWYGSFGFQDYMGGVTRLRCIENRRQAARCANIGQTTMIDQFGNTNPSVKYANQMFTSRMQSHSFKTLYSSFPNWFPIGLLVFAIFIFINHIVQKNKLTIYETCS